MSDLISKFAAADLYDQGLSRPVPPEGKCERCQQQDATVGRFCLRCYDMIEARHHVERETRHYVNDFCARVKEEAKKQAQPIERIAPPKNPIRTVEVKVRPVVEVRALHSGEIT